MVTPLAKRRKLVPLLVPVSVPVAEVDEKNQMEIEEDTPGNDKVVKIPTMNEMDEVIGGLLECLDNMKDPDDPIESMEASSILLKLKVMQRSVFEELQKTSKQVQEKKLAEERIQSAVTNLSYEQSHLEHHINSGKRFKLPNLEKMCRDEQYGEEDTMVPSKTRHEIINSFLKADIDEPEQHKKIIKILQNEINMRELLQRDVNLKQKELAIVKSKLHLKTQFLKGLPEKLRDVERASQPIQRFFQNQKKLSNNSALNKNKNNNNTDSVVHLIGSDRRTRLDMARKLSGPLYTLFVQIQSHLDRDQNNNLSIEVSSRTANASLVASEKSNSIESTDRELFKIEEMVVLLHIPIPAINTRNGVFCTVSSPGQNNSNVKDKKVTVVFMYMPKISVVIATTLGSDERYIDHSTLLPHLFPHDDGDWNRFTGLPITISADAAGNQKRPKKTYPPANIGRPYIWCNYIAGLHLNSGKDPSECLESSTMVVIRELSRRVRANATLTFILKTLVQLPQQIPMHSKMKGNNTTSTNQNKKTNTNCRLVKFKVRESSSSSAESSSSSSCSKDGTKCYLVDIKRVAGITSSNSTTNSSKNLICAQVKINRFRYPAIPPVWSLTCKDKAWGEYQGSTTALESCTNPLHDENLFKLEQIVNVDSLYELAHEDSEDTYDWILTHQLQKIMAEWSVCNEVVGNGI